MLRGLSPPSPMGSDGTAVTFQSPAGYTLCGLQKPITKASVFLTVIFHSSSITMAGDSNTSYSPLPLSTILHMLTIKLSSTNYLLWHKQMISLLTYHNLMGYVDGSIKQPPPTILTGEISSSNPAYASWIVADQRALILIQSSPSEEAMAETLGHSVIPLLRPSVFYEIRYLVGGSKTRFVLTQKDVIIFSGKDKDENFLWYIQFALTMISFAMTMISLTNVFVNTSKALEMVEELRTQRADKLSSEGYKILPSTCTFKEDQRSPKFTMCFLPNDVAYKENIVMKKLPLSIA
ncbi:hypothetical protein OSB04_025483 [Centaurea solstitialis]|uniref:Retrotransposon Copia-like N-terminal domain-containing protein n=1 Tax=Centaurea solstitialis TaxID=347529 RepID=A0AA38T1J7_9ASTR|nr:hypothetical protein OSB04_025483 [Centaurea solstitialis]